MRFANLCVFCVGAVLCLPGTAGSADRANKTEEYGWGSSWTAPATEQQRHEQALNHQCQALAKTGDFQGVVHLCDAELRAHPEALFVYVLRADGCIAQKDYGQAVSDLGRAEELAQRKGLPTAQCSLLVYKAKVHEQMQAYRAASEDLRSALRIDRNKVVALNNLAWLMATAPDPACRNGREAIALAKKALAAPANPRSYLTMDTLAAAYAEVGEYPHAIETGSRALEQARKEIKDAAALAKFQHEEEDRLHLFEQHHPYRLEPRP